MPDLERAGLVQPPGETRNGYERDNDPQRPDLGGATEEAAQRRREEVGARRRRRTHRPSFIGTGVRRREPGDPAARSGTGATSAGTHFCTTGRRALLSAAPFGQPGKGASTVCRQMAVAADPYGCPALAQTVVRSLMPYSW
jgi:hypothetical protein